jgi:hypothetical protein
LISIVSLLSARSYNNPVLNAEVLVELIVEIPERSPPPTYIDVKVSATVSSFTPYNFEKELFAYVHQNMYPMPLNHQSHSKEVNPQGNTRQLYLQNKLFLELQYHSNYNTTNSFIKVIKQLIFHNHISSNTYKAGIEIY